MAVTWTYSAPEGDDTTVEVTFTSDSPALTHVRAVNAVFTDGSYDADATEVRVSEVGAGVENKIAVGAITQPEEAGDPGDSEESGE